MKDSIEIPSPEELNNMNNSKEIKNLKKDLKNNTKRKSKTPNKLLKSESNFKENKLNNEINNIENKTKLNKRLKSAEPNNLNKTNTKFNNNKRKNFLLNKFSHSSNNFYKNKNFLTFNNNINEENENSSDENLSPIELRNRFQKLLGKLNDRTTKEVGFREIRNLIKANNTPEALRIYISCLSSNVTNSNDHAKEIFALIYGYLSIIYKTNLLDPFDKPPNLIKTIKRIINDIINKYLNFDSYVIHKACSNSINDIYSNCFINEGKNINNTFITFIEPFINILNSGRDKSSQNGAGICLSDFIYHLGSNINNNENNLKVLNTLNEKIVNLCIKYSIDNSYIFEALYNLINFIGIEPFEKYIKVLYDRFVFILCKVNKNKNNFLTKVNCLNLLSLIGIKIIDDPNKEKYYREDIYKMIELNVKDKNIKVVNSAKEALNTWNKLKEEIEKNKEENEDKKEEDEDNNYNKLNKKKLNKLNYLRNLAKIQKDENKKIDYDAELPEKMKDEVYKKGIGNILKLSKFLNYKNKIKQEKNNELLNTIERKKKKNKYKIKEEINNINNDNNNINNDNNDINNDNNKINKNESSENENNSENENDFKEEKPLIATELINENNNNNNKNKFNNFNFTEAKPIQATETINNNEQENNNEDDNNIENKKEIENYDEKKIVNKEEEFKKLIEDNAEDYLDGENIEENVDEQINNKENKDENVESDTDNNLLNKSNKINNEKIIIESKEISKKSNNENNKKLPKIKEHSKKINKNLIFNDLKNNFLNMFNSTLKSYNNFEKNINNKLLNLNSKLNKISFKINDIKQPLNQINEEKFKNSLKNEILIDIKKQMKESHFNVNDNNINNNDNTFDSKISKIFKESLIDIKNNNFNSGYEKILNSGDDLYLLRILYITGSKFDKLSFELSKKILMRINLICRSYQIQSLLLNLVENSLKNNIFNKLEKNEQNDILDSLYEFSGINNNIGKFAAKLYTDITK